MQGRKITILILSAFIAGTLLLVYIEYNSSKNINRLITANEQLMQEFNISTQLNELQKRIISTEYQIRDALAGKDPVQVQDLEIAVEEMEKQLSLQNYSAELSSLVQQKIKWNRQLIDTLVAAGKPAAAKLLNEPAGKELTAAILETVNKFDSSRKDHLDEATQLIDKSGQKAQQFSQTLIVLVLVSGAILFWYIISIIRRQILLIRQLNISEKKVKQSARIKENFMANMSHEIRTPMNAVLGFTDLLQQKPLDTEAKKYVATIKKSGENLLTIINDILDLSKIEAGMLRIEAVVFDIRKLVHSVEQLLKHKAEEKQLALVIETDPSIPELLEGDPTRLTQILVNLVGNGIKFTHQGSVRLTVSQVVQNDARTLLRFTIKDTGIGMDAKTLPAIFDRFRQAEDTTTRKFGGTGLGLAIVKELVSLQSGTIDVESQPGAGSLFRVEIPYKTAVHKPIEKPVPPPLPNPTPLNQQKNSRLLVVEDNEINQHLISQLLSNNEFLFDLAKNGKQALELLREKSYTLILMDIQMPEMDGYATTQEIRKRLHLDIPIIALTAHAMAGEREKCLGYGMNDYLSKPVREQELLKTLEKFILLEPSYSASYSCINLSYMREVSNGNLDYEQTVTRLFIDTIPGNLQLLEQYWNENSVSDLRQLAHSMKTTVSVMGINEQLQPSLDTLETDQLTEEKFRAAYGDIVNICEHALKEARQFYATIRPPA
ncbi:response regulator [Flavihumibacter sp. CACIAM 22H1]|uniref:response regulator n=1 Tax=Flavihumibacter sp. CACIAM 22H1 TaxID=1812911 RepID=UPI0007A90DDF|nr:response regulator [Flavihumibacter sp. CACIAM 22H1]KYP15185.1 MAG: hypothetical protein A1D16_00505 [Flavihumibacter sp. CACIAM 22H1]